MKERSYWEEAIDELGTPKKSPVYVPPAATIRAVKAAETKVYSLPRQKRWFEKVGIGMYFINENDELEAKIDWFIAMCLTGIISVGLIFASLMIRGALIG